MNLQITNEWCKKAVVLKQNLEKNFIVLGGLLLKIRDEELYKPDWEAFWEFCEGEMKMSESQASRLITAYKKLILEYGFTDEFVVEAGGWNEAYTVAKLARDRNHALELLEKGKLMPPSDFRKELSLEKVGEHKHDFFIVNQRQCRICGLREKIYDNN